MRISRSMRSSARSLSSFTNRSVPAFVFDIDGVLLRGKQRLQAGTKALQSLLSPDGTFRYPVMFLTNGGGLTEEDKAREITERSGVLVQPSQVVLSHTPMAVLADKYNMMEDAMVVCVGRRKSTEVARRYGFQRAIALEDLARHDTLAVPNTVHEHTDDPLPSHLLDMRIAAVMVMHDSRNWGRDIQLLCDILGSDGSPQRTPSTKQVVSMYASNPDFIYPNEYRLPRFGQGAFLTALEAVYERRFGRPLQYTQFGKPHRTQYDYIEPLLHHCAASLGFKDISKIYAIGDNPEADVRGANGAGGKWTSVLVRTGCFTGSGNDPIDPASIVVEDAYEGVTMALKESDPNYSSVKA